MIRFGPAGNSESFYEQGYKHTYQAFKWIHEKGLNALEYSFGRGVKLKEETAIKIGDEASKYGVQLSVHAPYYINLATEDIEKKAMNVNYLLDSAKNLKLMGGKRLVFHPGSYAKMTQEKAFNNIVEALKAIIDIFKNKGYSDILLCPETMGKKRQSGNLIEIMKLCALDDMIYPTIDFGHLHARSLGAIKDRKDFEDILNIMRDELKAEKYQNFHSHFSKIEFTQAGERRHRTFDDEGFGPDFDALAVLVKERNLTPTFICESKGTQADDAKRMKTTYETI